MMFTHVQWLRLIWVFILTRSSPDHFETPSECEFIFFVIYYQAWHFCKFDTFLWFEVFIKLLNSLNESGCWLLGLKNRPAWIYQLDGLLGKSGLQMEWHKYDHWDCPLYQIRNQFVLEYNWKCYSWIDHRRYQGYTPRKHLVYNKLFSMHFLKNLLASF